MLRIACAAVFLLMASAEAAEPRQTWEYATFRIASAQRDLGDGLGAAMVRCGFESDGLVISGSGKDGNRIDAERRAMESFRADAKKNGVNVSGNLERHVLNALGEHGWELAGIEQRESGVHVKNSATIFYLKRPKS